MVGSLFLRLYASVVELSFKYEVEEVKKMYGGGGPTPPTPPTFLVHLYVGPDSEQGWLEGSQLRTVY